MNIININTGIIQENTPYQTQADLIAYGLADWRFATDDEIATYKAQQIQDQLNDSLPLFQAYNAYIAYCRSLGLEDKATMQDFQTLALQQETEALTNSDLPALANAIKIPLMALGLINDISQAGGNWNNISWHDNI